MTKRKESKTMEEKMYPVWVVYQVGGSFSLMAEAEEFDENPASPSEEAVYRLRDRLAERNGFRSNELTIISWQPLRELAD